MCADLDNNGIAEIYVFVIHYDSLWLYWFDPMSSEKVEPGKILVSTIRPRDGIIEAYMRECGVQDMNADGYPDLIFAVEASFSAYPRKVAIFDAANQEIRLSNAFGAGIKGLQLYDLDGDGNMEIILNTLSHCNTVKGSVPYDDHSAWLMVMNHNLDFRFEPVELPGQFSSLSVWPFVENGTTYLVAMHLIYGAQHKQSALYTFDDRGNEMLRTDLINFDSKRQAQIFPAMYKGEQNLFIGSLTESIIQQTNVLHEKKRKVAEWELNWQPVLLDIDNNGQQEIIMFNYYSTKMRIFQPNFTHPVDIDLFEPTNQQPIVTLKKIGGQDSKISVQAGYYSALFMLDKSPFYNLRYLLYFAVYSVILSLIFLLQHLSSRLVKRRIVITQQLSTLQINNVLSQLDPHFTFNALHSIGSYILREQKEEAYDYLLKFSKVIRSGLSDADKVCRSLASEIEVLINYLRLQKLAYPGKFDFEINIAENVDQRWMVPKMILQTHVENALKHGIFPRQDKGLVKITVDAESKSFVMAIEDNGIGREEAKRMNVSTTRKGLELFKLYIGLFNNYNSEKIRQEIIDLYNPDGSSAGTRVTITIPIKYDYSLNER